MEGVEQEAGAARPGPHDAPDAVAAHDTIDTAVAHAANAAATAPPPRPKSVTDRKIGGIEREARAIIEDSILVEYVIN